MTPRSPEADRPQLPRNPFATRFTRPGRIAPLADDGPVDLASLLARARSLRTSSIEGPHGSGKTNLLVALAARTDRSILVRVRSLGDAVAVVRRIALAARGTLVCVDGWERMGRVFAPVAGVLTGLRDCTLVVTSHRRGRLPLLARSRPTVGILASIVAGLPDHRGLIDRHDVEEAFLAHAGNLREALYDLYDRFERRVR